MQQVQGRLDGARGERLYWQGWLPAAAPSGLLLICHGLGEHSGRYRTVVDTVLPDGWAAYGLDLRGHGHSTGRRAPTWCATPTGSTTSTRSAVSSRLGTRGSR